MSKSNLSSDMKKSIARDNAIRNAPGAGAEINPQSSSNYQGDSATRVSRLGSLQSMTNPRNEMPASNSSTPKSKNKKG